MVGWIILGVIAALIVVILCLRVSVTASFGDELHVTAQIGPVKLQVVPPPEKKPKKEKPKKRESGGDRQAAGQGEEKAESPPDCRRYPRRAERRMARHTRGAAPAPGRRIRIDPMRVSIVLGDENPANTAEWYGWVNAAVWTVMPWLEKTVHMPDPQVHMEMDFNAFETKVSGTVGISYRIGDLLAIGFAAAGPLLRFLLPFLKRQKAMKKEAAKKAAEQAAAEKKAETAPDKAA